MSQALKLQHLAIKAAQQQDWEQATAYNKALLEIEPKDLKTKNRLAAAYLHQGQTKEARETLKQILKLDSTNKLAQKNLERLKNDQRDNIPNFNRQYFIEEPGRSKLIELVRLGQEEVLDQVATGQKCQLDPKSNYISVTCDDQYLGALPKDISERLMPLIKSGNQYLCCVASRSSEHCQVYLKEHRRSAENRHLSSFKS